jgi:hypothetical protein
MLDVGQFRRLVVAPALHHVGLWSPAAENLLVGTAIQESRLRYLEQLGGGPARGVYQIEPTTHRDLFENWRAGQWVARHPDAALVTDLAYATVVCRLIYYRRPEPMPGADDIEGLARYWKAHYNTSLGKGTAANFVLNYREHC